MIREDLIFDWTTRDFHRGRKLASLAVAGLVFTFCFAALQVKLPLTPAPATKSAAMIRIVDDDFGRFWQMRAEEEGPFPGGLDSSGREDQFALLEAAVFGVGTEWGDYRPVLRELGETKGTLRENFAAKGKRFFPERSRPGSGDDLSDAAASNFAKIPVLIAFDERTQAWLPERLPEFGASPLGTANSSLWRFALSLRADGSVEHCISLGGEDSEGIAATTAWLRGLQFAPSEDTERWLALRLEFENEVSDGN